MNPPTTARCIPTAIIVCDVRGGGVGLPDFTCKIPPVGTDELRLRKKSVFRRNNEPAIQKLNHIDFLHLEEVGRDKSLSGSILYMHVLRNSLMMQVQMGRQ